MLQIYVLGFSIEHKFLRAGTYLECPSSLRLRRCCRHCILCAGRVKKSHEKQDGSAVQRSTVPAAHSFSHLAPPVAPVKLGLETSLHSQRFIWTPKITHLTPLSTGTKRFFMKPLLLCFSGSRHPMAILSCASCRDCSQRRRHRHLVPAPGLCLLLSVTPS